MNYDIGIDLYFPPEYLKAAVSISLLSVWVLVGLFYYLNRYTKRRYFTIWTVAWLFYAVWLTFSLRFQGGEETAFIAMVKQWCLSTSATFLIWGSARFLNQRERQSLLGLFLAFLYVWSYIGAYHLEDNLHAQLPIFTLVGVASMVTSGCYFQFRRWNKYIGAGLLAFGFGLWGAYLTIFPWLQSREYGISASFFIAAVLQLFIAVSMIILVLEEARTRNEAAMQQVMNSKHETEILQSRISSTEERYRSLFDQASEGIIITTTDDLRILELNQTAKRLLGIKGIEGGIQALMAYCDLPSEGPPKVGPDWFALVRENRRFNVVRRDGGITPVEVDGATIKFEGKPAYQFFFRELTERARLEQQLRQAEKLSALGQMISGVAHELNNPLAVIKGYVELILANHKLSDQTRSNLDKVAHECNRAAKLVSNFLSFAREQPAQHAPTKINELIQRVAELRQFDLRTHKVDLMLDLDPSLRETMADADQIQQVLVNLVTNSVQAMTGHKGAHKLTIRSRICKELITIEVQDNGPGIPPEIVSRIFEPFFTTKEVGTGTGLGLSIAHSILTDHKGRIYYEPAPGSGARFVLEFPLDPVTEEKAKAPIAPVKPLSPVTPSAARNIQVLILDDERAIAELLGEMLSMLGYQPTLAHSGATALELVDQLDFDVVLSDYRMPQMDGHEFYERAVKKKPYLAHRFIFLTGDVVNEDTQSFIMSTGNPHVPKPFQLQHVEEAVTRILNQPKTISA